jgi:uncharacterized protein YecE (DUF72 family)
VVLAPSSRLARNDERSVIADTIVPEGPLVPVADFGQLRMFGLPEETSGVGAAVPDTELSALGQRLPTRIRLGTSSWSFPGWEGVVYDRRASTQTLARHGLRAYARHPLFRTVGVDRTYYAPVQAETLARYAAVVPAGFRFLVKAHEDVTQPWFPRHDRYGDRGGLENPRFLDPGYAAEAVVAPFTDGLGDAAGPLLFQFPPLSVAAVGGPLGFAQRLGRCVEALPRGPLYAVELRNPDLLSDAYADALTAAGACHCLNSHPRMPPPARQARQLGSAFAAAPALVIRWMLSPRLEYADAKERYHPFDQIVDADPQIRESLAELVIADSRPSYVVVNNKAEGSSPLSVRALAERLARNLGSEH